MRREFEGMYETRVALFLKLLQKDIYYNKRKVDIEYSIADRHLDFEEKDGLNLKPIQQGESWGSAWQHAWFKLQPNIDESLKGKEWYLLLDFNAELLLFDVQGAPLYAFSCQSVFDLNYSRTTFPAGRYFKEDSSLWLEGTCNALFGVKRDEDPQREDEARHGAFTGKINHCEVALRDDDVFGLYMDVDVLYGLVKALDKDSIRRKRVLRGLNDVINAYQEVTGNAKMCLEITHSLLSKKAHDSALTVSAIGHAHIDTAWLWPVEESVKKCARTFSAQLNLIERYPDYVFGASQPQHFQFIKDKYPKLYGKIKSAVVAGNFEVQGGMWVEADCNITSGESLVRQIVHGKKFFYEEFGVDVKNLWLPDVFGYAASMPQILKKSGIDYFVTQKISWNQINKFPHHTFMWEGIDGTEILTHFLPADTYNGYLGAEEMVKAENRFVENDFLDECLALYGVGDGGGGPKEEMIERARRQSNLEGSPKVKMEKSQDFLDRLGRESHKLEKWAGELYLELHRGTLTTQARVKKFNRLIENRLQMVEKFSMLLGPSDEFREKLDGVWKKLLINQFHDILPGSSIKKVYDVTNAEYDWCVEELDKIIEELKCRVFEKSDNSFVLFNHNSFSSHFRIEVPRNLEGNVFKDKEGKFYPVETTGTNSSIKIFLKAFEVKALERCDMRVDTVVSEENCRVLENDFISYHFNALGEIEKAVCKTTGEQVLGHSNVMTLYHDRPLDWDAWDIDFYYEETPFAKLEMLESPKYFKSIGYQELLFKTVIHGSEIEQRVRLENDSTLLNFNTKVEWNQRHKMLRTAFDTQVFAQEAYFDIQYGYAKRANHRNTSWDSAKFEVVAHKYADISMQHRGVALINDSKYGHKVLGSVMDLNLLRSPVLPDADADVGTHEFNYAIYPHQKHFVNSDVIEMATRYNNSPLLLENVRGCKKLPVALESQDVSLTVMKTSEDSKDIIIRLVEVKGKMSSAVIEFEKAAILCETDLIERAISSPISIESGEKYKVELKPFEIKTYRLSLSN